MIPRIAPLIGCIAGLLTAPGLRANPSPPSVALPEKVYGVDGTSTNIYFRNLVYTPIEQSVLFDLEGGPAMQKRDRIVWHANEKKPGGRFTLHLYSGFDFQKIGERSAELVYTRPKPVQNARELRWLAIGDSLTAPGFYIEQTREAVQKLYPGITLTPVGSQTAPQKDGEATPIHHEGRGGWHWKRYLEAYQQNTAAGSITSPFVFGPRGADDFDFTRYLAAHHDGKAPEVITIFLGANDVFGRSPRITEADIQEIISTARTMVQKIRAAAPNTIIGILTGLPPSDQEGFALNYGNGVTEWQYRRAIQLYNVALIGEFDHRWDERLYIVPIHLGFDAATAYPASGGNTTNALHPKADGFKPVAQTLTAWFAYLLENGFLQ